MTRFLVTTTFTLAGLAVSACATPPPPPGPPEHHQPAWSEPAVRAVELPVPPGAGPGKEARVLVEAPGLKLATIVLRSGTVLPEHRAPMPVTIVALSGQGTVVAQGERLHLDPGHAVVLGPDVPHAVEPDAGADLVLLVHHLGQGEEHHQ